MDALLVDVGVLLSPGDHEFEAYNIVWDKAYGYYDEFQGYALAQRKSDAIAFAKEYVENGVEGTYAIIASTILDGGCVDEALKRAEDENDLFLEMDIEDEDYDVESVVFSACKKEGRLIEGFVQTRGTVDSIGGST